MKNLASILATDASENAVEQSNEAVYNKKHTLKDRFGAKHVPGYVFLMDIDSLKGNADFENIIGYINTEENKQQKGAGGSVK